MGSPPPAGSKKDVLMFRSVRSMVIAPARTGRDNKRSTVVILADHTNNGTRSSRSPFQRILITVVMKLIEPRIDEIPAKCSEKMARSTEGPAWAILSESGG